MKAWSDYGAHVPLSYGQEALLHAELTAAREGDCIVARALALRGRVSIGGLERAFRQTVRAHPMLAAGIVLQDGSFAFQFHSEDQVPFKTVDVRGQPLTEIARDAAMAVRRSFELGVPLVRATVWVQSDKCAVLMVAAHHAVIDFRSLGIVFEDLARAYGGDGAELEAEEVSYSEIALAQRKRFACSDEPTLIRAKHELSEIQKASAFPPTRNSTATSLVGTTIRARLGATSFQAARTIASEMETSLATVVLTGLCSLTACDNAEDEASVAVASAGRLRGKHRRVVGYLTNPVPVLARVSRSHSFRAAVAGTRRGVRKALLRNDVPYPFVGGRAGAPAIRILFTFQALRGSPPEIGALALEAPEVTFAFADLEASPVTLSADPALFDATLAVAPVGDQLAFALTVRASTAGIDVEAYLLRLVAFMERALADPDCVIADLARPVGAEYDRILTASHGPPAASSVGLARRIALQIAAKPESVAVRAGSEAWTYRLLGRHTEAITAALRLQSIGPGSIVGVSLQRSALLVAAILGIHAAGAAYLPLDSALPPRRRAAMIAQAAPVLVLEDDLVASWLQSAPQTDGLPHCDAPEDAPAYVLFTSGTSGEPKGVVIERRNVDSFITWSLGEFSAEQLRGVLASTPVGFDLSIFELLVPLCAGGTVVLARDLFDLTLPSVAPFVTLVNSVPSLVSAYLRARSLPVSVATVNLAGENVSERLAVELYEITTVRQVRNLYGPTETTVYSTCAIVPRDEEALPSIGRPIAGTSVFILDNEGHLVADHAVGEIVISGTGVGRGYIGGCPGSGRFIPDPSDPRRAAFATGDFAARRSNGNLEFLGRRDGQVKLHGVRVEVGEIEAILRRHPLIEEAVAVALHEEQNAAIVVFIVPDKSVTRTAGEEDDLTASLQSYLREFVATPPVDIRSLREWPRLYNGKVDQGALREIARSIRAEPPRSFAPPSSQTERRIAAIWASVLGLEQVGRDDDFFGLGGQSLQALSAVASIEDAFHTRIDLPGFMRASTLRELARTIDSRTPVVGSSIRKPIVPTRHGNVLRASPFQRLLWLHGELAPSSAAYAMPILIHVAEALDADKLRRAFDVVVARHEALRTVLALNDESLLVQMVGVNPRLAFSLVVPEAASCVTSEALLLARARKFAAMPFELARGPLVRAELVPLDDGTAAILLSVHHAVCDGWSLRIIVREIGIAYGALLQGDDLTEALPEQLLHYADAVAAQISSSGDESSRSCLSWWGERLAKSAALAPLPADGERRHRIGRRASTHSVTIPSPSVTAARRLAEQQATTPFVVYLAAAAAVVARSASRDVAAIAGANAARTREAFTIVGPLADLIIYEVPAPPRGTFAKTVRAAHSAVTESLAHANIPFAVLLERRKSLAMPFDLLLLVETESESAFTFGDSSVDVRLLETGYAKFEMTMTIVERRDGAYMSIEYDRDLFTRETVAAMTSNMLQFLAAAGDPSRTLGTIGGAPRTARKEPEVDATLAGSLAAANMRSTELRLAKLWQAALGVSPIGPQDNFFALGGHSLLAMRVAADVRETFGVRVSVVDLFDHPTLTALAARIDAARERPDDETLARVLAEVEAMSEDDVAERLSMPSGS